jgi:deazaflavin-dependent oxidoreductase (nitroreductase family)
LRKQLYLEHGIPTMVDTKSFEDTLIDDMRAHDGEVTTGPLAGHPLLVMWSRGAKSGDERRAILTHWRDGNDYIVAGTAGGSPTTPAWVYNVTENPDVTIEVKTRTFDARATVINDGPERDRLWDEHVARLPWFADYTKKTDRIIPMVRLTPIAE